jgi:hypothetical protein
MGSVGMMYIPSFIKIGSGIQKLMRGDTQTHRQQGDCRSLLLFFKIDKVGLKCLKRNIAVKYRYKIRKLQIDIALRCRE